ncbi:MAG: redox-sensing transcriptional repressor Rex [Bacillota bacterium]|nr:redox-sensing transcriptional repressor Rex [Bacillota bacterium]
MAKDKNISMSVIRRLPRYYRFLSDLVDKEVDRISSGELAKRMNLTASQVRQDFNCFGGFGQQGYGYSVKALKNEIESILSLKSGYNSVLIGVGNLGRAVAMHMEFEARGFKLIGAFDQDRNLIGKPLNHLIIKDIDGIDSFCDENKIDVAILCIPKEAAESIVEKLYGFGVRYFWNFSHFDISVAYPDTIIENVHMSDSLMTLCYRITDAKRNITETIQK